MSNSKCQLHRVTGRVIWIVKFRWGKKIQPKSNCFKPKVNFWFGFPFILGNDSKLKEKRVQEEKRHRPFGPVIFINCPGRVYNFCVYFTTTPRLFLVPRISTCISSVPSTHFPRLLINKNGKRHSFVYLLICFFRYWCRTRCHRPMISHLSLSVQTN